MTSTPRLFEFRFQGDPVWFGYCYDRDDRSYGFVFKKEPNGDWCIHGEAGAGIRHSIESAMAALRDSV